MFDSLCTFDVCFCNFVCLRLFFVCSCALTSCMLVHRNAHVFDTQLCKTFVVHIGAYRCLFVLHRCTKTCCCACWRISVHLIACFFCTVAQSRAVLHVGTLDACLSCTAAQGRGCVHVGAYLCMLAHLNACLSCTVAQGRGSVHAPRHDAADCAQRQRVQAPQAPVPARSTHHGEAGEATEARAGTQATTETPGRWSHTHANAFLFVTTIHGQAGVAHLLPQRTHVCSPFLSSKPFAATGI